MIGCYRTNTKPMDFTRGLQPLDIHEAWALAELQRRRLHVASVGTAPSGTETSRRVKG